MNKLLRNHVVKAMKAVPTDCTKKEKAWRDLADAAIEAVNSYKDSYAGGDMGEGPAVKAASTGTLTEELDAAHNDMREKHFGSSYRKFPGGGSTQNTENECQHYSMTVNGKCNRCGHSLTAEERRFFEP